MRNLHTSGSFVYEDFLLCLLLLGSWASCLLGHFNFTASLSLRSISMLRKAVIRAPGLREEHNLLSCIMRLTALALQVMMVLVC